ncbi:MAG: zinc-dependent metalloprotease [Actinomycetes bacterium]
MIDWDLALSTATRLVPPGPKVSLGEATDVVNTLRDLADEAEGHVRAYTGMSAELTLRDPVVVDRPGWVTGNVEGFRFVLGPLLDRLAERRTSGRSGWVLTAVGSRITGAELGLVLAFLASKVLGQYEIFLPPGEDSAAEHGRLSLVAPNIVATERALDVDPRDFRLWVCLHECTHRTQFTAVPWLRDHFTAELTQLLDATDLDPTAMLTRLRSAAGAMRGQGQGQGQGRGLSLIEAVQTPQQREILDRLTAVMSLLEGHAEHVMDAVGPDVVPSVGVIRQRFDARRVGGSPVQRVLRKLLGLDLKLKQYADGNRFVSAVVRAAGLDAFNRVWESPQTLPTRAEVNDPNAWMARVLGTGAAPASVESSATA